jgi:hypothetical protein
MRVSNCSGVHSASIGGPARGRREDRGGGHSAKVGSLSRGGAAVNLLEVARGKGWIRTGQTE